MPYYFLYSRSQHVTLIRILSSAFSVKAGVLQPSVLGPVLFLIFINDLSDFLESPLYRFANDSTLCDDIPHPSDRQTQPLPSLQMLTKSQHGQTLGVSLSILINVTLSKSTPWQMPACTI